MRSQNRPADWRDVAAELDLPDVELTALDPPPWADALDAYETLRNSVLHQHAVESTLAAAVAEVDLSDIASFNSPMLQLVGRLRGAAIESDLVTATSSEIDV